MNVFCAHLANTANFLDKQMPQDLAVQDSCVEVGLNFPRQMIQGMLTMDLVLLVIIVKKEQQMAQCVLKEHSDPTLGLSLEMIVCLALEENTALHQDFLLLQVTVVQGTIVLLRKTSALHFPAASNVQGGTSVQMALLILMVVTQGRIREGSMKLHVMSAQRVISVLQTRLIPCLVPLVITVLMVHIHQ